MTRIAVVDDDHEVLDFMATVLGQAGHDVVKAHDGLSTLALVEQYNIDLMVLDILMPNRDGLETIMILRRDGKTFPILAISAGGMLDGGYLLQTAKTFGAEATLLKPFTAETLTRQVESLLTAA